MRARTFAFVAALAHVVGCGAAALPKPPQVDPTEQWLQAGKKVDFAVAETKAMLQRARGAAYLPDLYMRLAELYTERARYAWLVVYERRKARGDESRAVEAPEARLLKNLAITTYARVVREFPAYARNDDALFLMGHEYRELGDFDKMKETYERLVESYPKSPHRLEAYLTLGDHAFDASELPTAQRYYEKILAEPQSSVHPLARYKLAWVKVNQGDCKEAVRLFEVTLRDKPTGAGELSAGLLRTQKNLNVMREALIDLAYCYPDIYPDRPAVPYFSELATSSTDYLAAMRRLANRYSVKEMRPQAAVALRAILDGTPGDEDAVELSRRLYDSVVKAGTFDAPADDVARLISSLDKRLSDYRIEPDVGRRLVAEFEIYARDIATRAHVVAKESRSVPALSLVADAYHAYLSRFGGAAAAEEIRQNYAEALLSANRHYDAGRAFEELASLTQKADVGKQARLNAVAAYQQALESPQLGRLHRLSAWSGIRSQGRRVIAEMPGDPAVLGIKLSIARSHYETGEYETAAHLFYAVARQYPMTNEGVAAAHLSLDALRLADNLEELTTVGGWLVADSRLREDVRKELREIVSTAAQRQVEEVTASDSSDREQQLLALAERHKGSEVGEEAFYNTLLLARSNGDLARFYELGDQFLAKYPASSKRADVESALATVASDSADFVKEGKYMVAAFAADPAAKGAQDRLYTAASLHAVLGDAAVVGEIAKLAERGNSKTDDLLVLIARSGNLGLLEQTLKETPLTSPAATFFRGYLALQRGEMAEARAAFTQKGAPPGDLARRARFLLGEIAYAEFRGVGAKGDLAATLDANVKALAAVDAAFKPVIEGNDAQWVLAGLARVADANARFASFLRGLELPSNLSAADKEQLKGALLAQATNAEKKAAQLRTVCANQAKKAEIISEAGKACLLGESLPEPFPMYRRAQSHPGSDPPAAAAIQKTLLTNPKDVDALAKLAELHLGAGNPGIALLLLERAEQLGTRTTSVPTLLGLTYYQLGEPQEAFAAFKEAVARKPADAHAHLNLAAHFAAFGHMDRARAELQKSGGLTTAARGPTDHPDIALLGALGDAKKAGGGAP